LKEVVLLTSCCSSMTGQTRLSTKQRSRRYNVPYAYTTSANGNAQVAGACVFIAHFLSFVHRESMPAPLRRSTEQISYNRQIKLSCVRLQLPDLLGHKLHTSAERSNGLHTNEAALNACGLWSKRWHRNDDKNGYIQKGNKPKQHLCSSSEAYIIEHTLYTYMQLLSYMIKVQYSIAHKAWC